MECSPCTLTCRLLSAIMDLIEDEVEFLDGLMLPQPDAERPYIVRDELLLKCKSIDTRLHRDVKAKDFKALVDRSMAYHNRKLEKKHWRADVHPQGWRKKDVYFDCRWKP